MAYFHSKVHNFGPLLYENRIPKHIINKLKQEAYRSHDDHSQHLAGRIKKEVALRTENNTQSLLYDYIMEYVDDYIHKALMHQNMDTNALSAIRHGYDIQFTNVWVNFQKNSEYNPQHRHVGDLSYVIYLDIPEEIYEEPNHTNDCPNGSIQFSYMEAPHNYGGRVSSPILASLQPVSDINLSPRTGDFFLFPSYLMHSVTAFYTPDVTRLSLSGNIFINEKNNSL